MPTPSAKVGTLGMPRNWAFLIHLAEVGMPTFWAFLIHLCRALPSFAELMVLIFYCFTCASRQLCTTIATAFGHVGHQYAGIIR